MSLDSETVLFANEAFYQAFVERDIDAMDKVWSSSDSVTCIHPGWVVLNGRERVMQSWAAIFRNDGDANVTVHAPRAYVMGDAAYVLCYEELGGTFLVATNVFVRKGSRWYLVHHQAGPSNVAPPVQVQEKPREALH